MSDVTVAPAGGAPPAAPTNEVVVTPPPASAPAPVGSQAPDKPVGDIKGSEHRPQSRREAIQAAFDRASNPPPKTAKPAERPAPKAAEAKPGHNQPPEETKPEGIDLKKRPADQPRGERGQFAPRETQQARQQETQQQQPREQQQRPVNPLPANAPFREAPSRFSEKGKAEWHQASENVRADVHRMERDFGEAYKRYRGDYETMETLRPFHQLASKQGTTLQRAMTNYVNMETKLRQDPIGGLDVIVSNLNLRASDGQKLTLRDIAYHVLSQTPEQQKLLQQSNVQQAAQQQIGSLHAEIAGLKNTLQQMHTQAQFSYTRSAVDQFADTHPRFDELGDLIERELTFGFDLETAYRRAELLRPTTHAAQTRSASAQTRTADKSISGSPGAGPSTGTQRRADQPPVGRRDAIQNAIRRVGTGT